jgi:ATP-dependent RNA helicase DDX27
LLQRERSEESGGEEDDGFEGGLSEQEGVECESDAERDDQAEDDCGASGGEDGFFEEAPLPLSDVNFTDMNLSRPLLKAVHVIGYENPTPIQAATVPMALLGKDICACAATGTGKTAAFLLPILERLLFRPTHNQVSRILILVPTRELAIQVHSVGKALAKHTNVEFCLATGGLDSRGQEAMLRKHPDIIIATPGRLVDHLHNAPSFNLSTIEILVLDEADRMLDEHFQDQMHEIIQHCPKKRQTMLFSATMTDKVEELAAVSLNHPVRLFVDRNTDTADNLQQEFVRIRTKREGDREAIVTALCSRTFKGQCLVFLQTKALAHRMRIIFGLLGLQAAELHGNRTQLQRIEALKLFKEDKVDFLLATDLAARGLDIDGVKTVINYNMPPTVKQYIHRVGRTARAGRSGRSVSLVGESERKMLKEVVKRAKVPAKSRVVPQDVVIRYRDQIRKLAVEIKSILKEEKEERELRCTEMEMNKARNLLDHNKEIFSRPPRTWIQKRPASSRAEEEIGKDKKTKHAKKVAQQEDPEAKKIRFEREYAARQAKKQKRPKKIYAMASGDGKKKGKGVVKTKPVIEGFERELTDTSKHTVRGFRKTHFKPKSKGSGFKSKRK